MHAVRCPQCKCLLSMDRPLLNAELRCDNCGAAFVASTKWVERAPTGAAAQPGEVHMYHSPRRRPAPRWPIFVVAFGGPGIILTIIGIWYFANYKRVEVKTPGGEVEYSTRMTAEDARQFQEDVTRKSRERLQAARSPEAWQSRPATGAPKKAPDLMPGGEDWRRLGSAPQPGARLAIPAKSDPKINVFLSHHPLETGLGGHVSGRARNGYDAPLRSVDVTVVAIGADDRPLAVLGTATCNYVPPGQAVPFCVEYRSILPQQIARLEGFASATRAADSEVYWRIDPLNCQTEIRGSTYILRGKTRNLSGQAVTDARIYCDFFDADGLWVGSAFGSLDDKKTRIGEKRHAFFTVEFDAAKNETLPQVIERSALRLIARKF